MRVLIADTFDAFGLDELRRAGCEVEYEPQLRGEALAGHLRTSGTRVLIVRGTSVDAAALSSRSLALVVRAGAGYNTIDVPEASRRGIYVANCPGRNAVAVAELVMGLILALDRHIPDNVADLRNGRWNKRAYSSARGLAGRTLGLLGFGHIARQVAQRAHAFEMNLLIWSRRFTAGHLPLGDPDMPLQVAASPQAVAEGADVLSVHLALTPQTRRFVDRSIFDRLRSGAMFVNTSRAEVVDTGALAHAITTRGIRAGLDVYDDEPREPVAAFHTPLAALPGVYGTHHIGASTEQAQQAVAAEAVRIVLRFKTIGEVANAVNLAEVAAR